MPEVTVFLSYAEDTEGERVAQELKDALSKMHVTAVIAKESIPPGADWLRAIGDFLEESAALICVGTKGFSSRPWCQQEIGWALGRHVPVLWIQYDSDEPPAGFVTSRQALILSESDDAKKVAREIISWLADQEATRSRIVDVLLSALEDSNSYQHARECAKLLARTGTLTSAEWDRAVKAAHSNRQVGEATEWEGEAFRRRKVSILDWLDHRVGPSSPGHQQ